MVECHIPIPRNVTMGPVGFWTPVKKQWVYQSAACRWYSCQMHMHDECTALCIGFSLLAWRFCHWIYTSLMLVCCDAIERASSKVATADIILISTAVGWMVPWILTPMKSDHGVSAQQTRSNSFGPRSTLMLESKRWIFRTAFRTLLSFTEPSRRLWSFAKCFINHAEASRSNSVCRGGPYVLISNLIRLTRSFLFPVVMCPYGLHMSMRPFLEKARRISLVIPVYYMFASLTNEHAQFWIQPFDFFFCILARVSVGRFWCNSNFHTELTQQKPFWCSMRLKSLVHSFFGATQFSPLCPARCFT